jgi:hypothetical protein
MGDPLDEDKLAQIRAWAEAMLTDERAELRAAARGLLIMADEVERLWEATRDAFATDIGTALADRLGVEPTTASSEVAFVDPPLGSEAAVMGEDRPNTGFADRMLHPWRGASR